MNISGFNLQDGHRPAILGSTDCQGALVQVLNAPNSGMSRPATEDSQYVWGDVPADFITEGGIYSLCWCPGMHGILCDDFAQYQLSAGELTVLGPRHDHNFRCVRGQDCGSSNLRPLQGLHVGFEKTQILVFDRF